MQSAPHKAQSAVASKRRCCSLSRFYPGRDIDAMRVALPQYRAAAYSPDAGEWFTQIILAELSISYLSSDCAYFMTRVRTCTPGAIETALNGWMASGSDHALRLTWPYGSKCNAPPLPGFPSTPCNYPLDGGRRTRWSELRPTLIARAGRGLGGKFARVRLVL